MKREEKGREREEKRVVRKREERAGREGRERGQGERAGREGRERGRGERIIMTNATQDNEWLNTTCTEAFRLLVEFYTEFFDKISFLLHAILDLVVACILQGNLSN